MRALKTAPPGAQFEVGETWTKGHGWRPYQRIGDKVLIISPDQARGVYATYEKMGSEPQWRGAWEGMKDIFTELKMAADECDRKNREKIVPDTAAEHLPSEGTA
jgi:hypothetical protein